MRKLLSIIISLNLCLTIASYGLLDDTIIELTVFGIDNETLFTADYTDPEFAEAVSSHEIT